MFGSNKSISVFPTIMRDFYTGSLPHARVREAARELEVIKQRLARFLPDQVVWDFDYFVTSVGKDLIEALSKAFSESVKSKQDVVIT